jgi:hypothetical protein
MLYVSLAASAVLAAITYGLVAGAKDRRSAYLKVWLGLPVGFIPCACVLPTYLLHAFLLGIVAMTCRWMGSGPRGFFAGSLTAFLVSYAVIGVPRAVALWQAARQHPFESLESRLAYEPHRPSESAEGTRAKSANDDPGDSFRDYTGRRRTAMLQRIHENSVHAFVNSPGFGVVRMIGPSLGDLRRADPIRTAPPLPLPEPPSGTDVPSLSVGDLVLEPDKEAAVPASGLNHNELRVYHRLGLDDFADPLGFGFVRDRRQVAGFLSHRFTRYPPKPGKEADAAHWRIESLDLVSLLKHPEPVAYVSKHLPRMDELRDAPTRPLDEFEAERLPNVRAGEEISAAYGPRRIRLLGAIRARDACLKCHSVDPGELLGAFSYDLRRDLPATP